MWLFIADARLVAMEDEAERSDSPAEWPKPAIPSWVVVASVTVAILAVSALLWVLFQKTTGPGEIVHNYYEAAASGDCDGAYSLLSPGLQQAQDADPFCTALKESPGLEADPKIEAVTLIGPEGTAKAAQVSVDGCGDAPSVTWALQRQGETWVITSIPEIRPCV